MLYTDVAEQIETLIHKGVLRPGERIPSVRKLSSQRRVSVSTVLQAYLLLENKGLIEARPQSGYYVRQKLLELPPVPRMSSPSTTATSIGVGDLIRRIFTASRNPEVIQLGSAVAAPELLPTLALNRTLAATIRKMGLEAGKYEFPPGNLNLRRQIARRSLETGCSLSPDEIVITSGGLEALHLCLRAVAKAGDVVAIESPTYYGILQALEILQIKALEIPTDPREGLCLDALHEAIKRNRIKAVVSMPTFHNPLGSLMPEDKKKALVELLSRYEIPLIEDDVYGDLGFTPGGRPKCARAFDKKGLVMLCSSFSKTLSPGFRVGWVAGGRYSGAIESLKFMNTIATATLPQAAIGEFLNSGGYDKHLRKLRSAFASQIESTSQAVCRSFPPGTKVTRPSGGMVLWVELPGKVDTLDLHDRALKEGISIAPGLIFSPKQKFSNFIRLNCGHPWSPRLDAALARLGKLVEQSR